MAGPLILSSISHYGAMSNQIPLSGAANVSGGYLLPPEQGEILVNGILVETGAIQIAGDARSTSARKTNFPIWLGRPTAGPVAEGAAKGVTGASFGQASINIQKFASIVLFTDEQIEDLQNGDLNVLVDAGVRQALSVAVDGHAAGAVSGFAVTSVFDQCLLPMVGASGLTAPVAGVTWNSGAADGLQKAVSAAMGQLESNGYGNPADIGVLLGFGFQQGLRDARDSFGRPLYDGGTFGGQSIDPLYGMSRAHSTNLCSTTADNTATATLTNSSNSVSVTTSPNGTVGLIPGAPVTGTNIPAGSYIGTVTGTAFPYTITLVNSAGAASNATGSGSETIYVGQTVGVVCHKPNVHVRVREDVRVKASNEASIVNGGTTYNLFQENLTALLYEMRLGFMVHDAARAVVPIFH